MDKATGFELSFEFVEKFCKISKPEYFQIYIYLLAEYRKRGKFLTAEELEKELGVRAPIFNAALEFWITCGKIRQQPGGSFEFTDVSAESGQAVPVAPRSFNQAESSAAARARFRPSYGTEEIDAAMAADNNISSMFKQAEKILGKFLTKTDAERLYSFHDWLGLPVEVITMLLQYAANHDKKGWRYLEKVAMDWADKGIDTYEKAEAHVSELEEFDSKERKVRAALGIYDRALTTTEKKYIKQWTQEKNIPLELIAPAYDRTVAKTGKLSWAYMNKILISWTEEGLFTVEAVQAKEEAFKQEHSFEVNVPQAKKSRFNNYTDPNKIDYDSISRQILDDLLDEKGV